MDFDICINKRRDTRHFTKENVPDNVITKALNAAHAAPSVGLTEPWRFVVVKSVPKKQLIKELFDKSNFIASTKIENIESRNLYKSLKLEAILDSPIGIAIFCDMSVLDNFTIGTIGNTNTLEWSCACAVQNLWLSLTAQEYGAGWVSILNYEMFNAVFDVPKSWKALGYMCVGKPATDYNGEPMLQKEKWRNKTKNPIIKFV